MVESRFGQNVVVVGCIEKAVFYGSLRRSRLSALPVALFSELQSSQRLQASKALTSSSQNKPPVVRSRASNRRCSCLSPRLAEAASPAKCRQRTRLASPMQAKDCGVSRRRRPQRRPPFPACAAGGPRDVQPGRLYIYKTADDRRVSRCPIYFTAQSCPPLRIVLRAYKNTMAITIDAAAGAAASGLTLWVNNHGPWLHSTSCSYQLQAQVSPELNRIASPRDGIQRMSAAPTTPVRCPSPMLSDASWTNEDTFDPVYFAIDQQIQMLILSETQNWIRTVPLTSRQRRSVRTLAQVRGLFHETIDDKSARRRRVVIGKWPNHASTTSTQTTSDMAGGERDQNARGIAAAAPLPSHVLGTMTVMEIPAAEEAGAEGTPNRRARRRQQRQPGHFRCESCGRSFDRVCDLRKHEVSHRPGEHHRHVCPERGYRKDFRYPKDVRRHQLAVHRRCECGTRFVRMDDLRRHQTSHAHGPDRHGGILRGLASRGGLPGASPMRHGVPIDTGTRSTMGATMRATSKGQLQSPDVTLPLSMIPTNHLDWSVRMWQNYTDPKGDQLGVHLLAAAIKVCADSYSRLVTQTVEIVVWSLRSSGKWDRGGQGLLTKAFGHL